MLQNLTSVSVSCHLKAYRALIDRLLINAPSDEWRNVHAIIHLMLFGRWSLTRSSVPLSFNVSRSAGGFALKLHDGYISEGRLALSTGSQIWKGESLNFSH